MSELNQHNSYESYLEDWAAPIHATSEKDLSPLSKVEFEDLTTLTTEEELALEECIQDLEPLSNNDYINIIATIKGI